MKFFSLMLLSIALLTSCVGTPNIKSTENLTVNEGIAVTNCKTPNLISRYIMLYPEDYKPSFGRLPPGVECTQNGVLAVIKLKAGKYYMGVAGYTPETPGFRNLPEFTIQPNKINYIGDLRIAVRETNVVAGLLAGFAQPKINISAVDEEKETLRILSEVYPDLIALYKVVSDIARKK